MQQHLEAGALQPLGRALGQQAVLEAAAGQRHPRARPRPAPPPRWPPPGRCGSARPMIPAATPRRKSARTASTSGCQSRTTDERERRIGVSSLPSRHLPSGSRHEAIGYAPASRASAANSSAIAAWPSKLTCCCRPISAATPSNSRPALVVTGALTPLREHLRQQLALGRAQSADRGQIVHLQRRVAVELPQQRQRHAPRLVHRRIAARQAERPQMRHALDSRPRRPAGTRRPRSSRRCRSPCRPRSRPAPAHRRRSRPGRPPGGRGGAGRDRWRIARCDDGSRHRHLSDSVYPIAVAHFVDR